MSEIEKMYKTIFGEFAPNCSLCVKLVDCKIFNNTRNCNKFECDYKSLFTAEKQLELIKYFSNNYNISINKDNNIFRLLFLDKDGIHNFYTSGVGFAEQLALFVISRYKNKILTEEERKQIKEILE